MSAIIWLIGIIVLLIISSFWLIYLFLDNAKLLVNNEGSKIGSEDEKSEEQEEELTQIYYEDVNSDYEDKTEGSEVIVHNEEDNAINEQPKKKANFNYDNFKFELKFNEEEILAATGEEVLEDEMTLECFADKKTSTDTSLSEEEMRRLALHETGHVYIALALGVKITKVALKADDIFFAHTTFSFGKKIYTPTDKNNYMCILLGGYCAEMFFLQEPSTLSSSDLDKVRDVALSKGTKYSFDAFEDQIYKDVDDCTERAKKLIKEHKDEIEEFASTLRTEVELKGKRLYDEINRLRKKYKKKK